MNIVNVKDKNSLQYAAAVLEKGGVLIFPTDTVYGIGCLFFDKSIGRLYKIKNRPLSQPTTVLLSENLYHRIHSSVKSDIEIPVNMWGDFLDGKVTIIFPISIFKMRFPKITTKDNKIGIRLPQSTGWERLLDMIGPIVTSSANKKGEFAPTRFEEIDPKIIESADLAIKTGEILPGIPSRVFDLELGKYLR